MSSSYIIFLLQRLGGLKGGAKDSVPDDGLPDDYISSDLADEVSKKINFVISFGQDVISYLQLVAWKTSCDGNFTQGDRVQQLVLLRTMKGNFSLLSDFCQHFQYSGFVLKDEYFAI
jgi:hypothetical protein